MPRTLPWLTGSDGKRVKSESTPRPNRGQSETAIKNESKPTADAIPAPETEKRDFFRSSQTPPTSPIQRCPSEEFLLEGLDHDDIYIMVEDEFYTVAQSFTQHLHYAEYVRRKKEAKLQNADAIKNIERPTDGVTAMTQETISRKEAEALKARQKADLEHIHGKRPRTDSENEEIAGNEDEDDDSMWLGTHLHDLMMSPRKTRSLVGLQGIKSATRAAAGYVQPSGPAAALSDLPARSVSHRNDLDRIHTDVEAETDADDDLNIQHVKTVPRAILPPKSTSVRRSTTAYTQSTPSHSGHGSKISTPAPGPTPSKTLGTKKSRLQDVPTFL
ncbi:hypothetical protein ASPZODRAFT_11989 [Penicilliopsis zonata CBS 506.65]|uniref:Uncharacterized protein n=1 Tax=Penicilliopsis zonata CBS 506.65 TaxID=1073090 RepID=A0A1L9SVG8_9EURO|nr:hypothetical protein ASPZODRAFT_11989 [Penicilliopsis zonata CBS 506.65]OJJ51146.1 hypothetical protein ASPZODRAFT_11989 [Penicilliopsis zonata CBS 506.65]